MGILSLQDALALARERELDLVEVAPAADPPVCRLLDYGRFRYSQNKKEREAKKSQKATGLREVRLRPNIGQHDLDFKSKIVKKLLATGAKVKIGVIFRGRSITHPDLGVGLLRRITEGLKDDAKLESPPAMEGRMLSIILVPIATKDNKARPAAPAAENKEQPVEAAVSVTQGTKNAKDENT